MRRKVWFMRPEVLLEHLQGPKARFFKSFFIAWQRKFIAPKRWLSYTCLKRASIRAFLGLFLIYSGVFKGLWQFIYDFSPGSINLSFFLLFKPGKRTTRRKRNSSISRQGGGTKLAGQNQRDKWGRFTKLAGKKLAEKISETNDGTSTQHRIFW